MSTRSTRIRASIASVVVLALVVGFVVRLADIQVVRAAELNAQADGRRGVTEPIYGTRGDIVDRSGTVLADTVDRWDLTVSPRYVKDPQEGVAGASHPVAAVLARIGEITGQDPLDLQTAIMAELERNAQSDYLVISRGLTAEQFDAIRAFKREWQVPYLYTQRHPGRVYPAGAVAGNLVGFMGSDQQPLAGVELAQQSCLEATEGQRVFDRARDGTPIPGSETTVPAVDGGTLGLTIDADVQYQAQQIIAQYQASLGSRSATAIVMRTDGTIVAVAETPTVDPNAPTAVGADYRGSRAFTAAFEPGSIFKSVTMAAMVDLGLVRPTDKLTVPWTYFSDQGLRVRDAHVHPTMQWTAAGAFVNSSNSGMVSMAEGLDRADLYDYLGKFGFGEQTAVGFAGEQAVALRDPASLDAQTRLNVMFGQGIAVTPIQIASAYQAIANNGVRLPARLIDRCTQADGTVVEPTLPDPVEVVSPATAETMRNMMEYVVTDYGISTFPIEGYRIAAKTGTAQVAFPDGSGYDPNRMIITTAGMFPVDKPEYVVLVQFDSPQTERTSAGAIPAFHDIVSLLIRQYDIPPSTTQQVEIPLEWQ